MSDEPVRLPDYKVDELFRAAMRAIEEHARMGDKTDGVSMVRVPAGIFDRLARIVASCERDAGNWRP